MICTRGLLLPLLAALLAVPAGCGGGGGGGASSPVAVGREQPGRSGRAMTPDEEGPDGEVEAAPAELAEALRPVVALIAQQRTPDARAQLDAYLAAHPDDGQAVFLYGLSYHREKRYGLARPHFERAIALAPDYPMSYYFLGWCCYYLGDLPAARQAFERHLSAEPDQRKEADSIFGLGLIDLEEDRLDDAEQRFRRTIALEQGDQNRAREISKAHVRLADVYERRDSLEQARDELVLATRLWPQHYAAFFKLSRVLIRLGDTEGAGEAFKQYRYWQARAEPPRGVPEPSS
jgi:tetratricopeptide (TPR) repeat protein